MTSVYCQRRVRDDKNAVAFFAKITQSAVRSRFCVIQRVRRDRRRTSKRERNNHKVKIKFIFIELG